MITVWLLNGVFGDNIKLLVDMFIIKYLIVNVLLFRYDQHVTAYLNKRYQPILEDGMIGRSNLTDILRNVFMIIEVLLILMLIIYSYQYIAIPVVISMFIMLGMRLYIINEISNNLKETN